MSTRTSKIAALVVLATFSLACSRGTPTPPDETPAITQAVKAYVREVKKIEVDKIDIAIKELKIVGDKAECQASFALKEQKEMAFTYAYTLEKKAGQWTVLSSASAGQGHAAMPGAIPGAMEGGMPPGHPPLDEANAPMADPHGMSSHPPVGGGMPSPHGAHPPPSNAPAK